MRSIFSKNITLVVIVFALVSCTKEKSQPQPFTATMNDSYLVYNSYWASVSPTGFSISGQNISYLLTISGNVPLAVGTYKVSGATNSNVSVTVVGQGEYNGGTWATDSTGTGVLTITNYNTSTNVVSGTFSFTANLHKGTESNTTLNFTNGLFTDISFK